MKWHITYTYDNPHGAGPFKGKAVVFHHTKPEKGELYYAPFGRATIKSVRKAAA